MKSNFSKSKLFLLACLVLCVFAACSTAGSGKSHNLKTPVIPFEVVIPSTDEVLLQGTMYLTDDKTAPFILLCHRAQWSRGEYLEIAPKLNAMGFNCLAIDQRSGNEINGVLNTSAAVALSKGLPTRYIDALPDINAALDYLNSQYKPGTLLLWGSSYSASLSLVTASVHPTKIDGVITFSPGEYFSKQGKTNSWIKESASGINCPVFITAKKKEAETIQVIFDAIPAAGKIIFIPESEGKHGSEALFASTEENGEYWKALQPFLFKFL